MQRETSPLIRSFSIDEEEYHRTRCSCWNEKRKTNRRGRFRDILVASLVSFPFLLLLCYYVLYERETTSFLTIENAKEYRIPVDDKIEIWFRIWGNRKNGVPVLFVHGGPGQAVADYKNRNKRFFDESELFVVEVDQRGTGKSQPSVRDDMTNMRYYQDISIDLISRDFEVVRAYLGIEKWLVWGGSYGSTIALDYGTRFPNSCLSLILRGIYLDTIPEIYSVYSRQAFKGNPKRQSEFDTLHRVASEYARKQGQEDLDKNDSIRLFQLYYEMIINGSKKAIWAWFVFENNLMEENPRNLLDPYEIDESLLFEAQSVAFFETRLWLHSVEEPSNLLQRVDHLKDIPIWICQGLRDEVCPPENAQHLVKALNHSGTTLVANFIHSGHEDTDPMMEDCLKKSISEFLYSINYSGSRSFTINYKS